MKVEERIHQYLRGINASTFDRSPDRGALKLRRILDSISMAEFVTYLEKTFSIRITDEDVLARNFESVASVVAFVKGRSGSV